MDNDQQREIEITAIHDDNGYKLVREHLARQYNLGDREPNIQITNIDIRGNRTMKLQHQQHSRKPLDDNTDEVLKHLHQLWGFDIKLDSVWGGKVTKTFSCPQKK